LIAEPVEGIITKNYAPLDDNDIKEGERVFYTHNNAVIIDTVRKAIDDVPESYKKFFLAPLLYEASVHVNTSGVFKGFYKSRERNVGKFGGDGENALERILGKIELKKPVFSNYNCQVTLFKEDANVLVKHLRGLDITYIDPPYNQHPYGSNYFMLNTIVNNRLGNNISTVAGIPDDWNKSSYNKKNEALKSFEELVRDIDSKYLIISYNNEGFIKLEEMQEMLSKYGTLTTKEIDYVAFRGSRNLQNRNTHTTEYLFIFKKN
jgi:adenine-specific DNA-methyltransferase